MKKICDDKGILQKIPMKFRWSLGSISKFILQKEADEFLNTHDLPKLNHDDLNNLNTSITSDEIETVIIFQQRWVQDQMDSWLNSTR
jgi:hypothetical protein